MSPQPWSVSPWNHPSLPSLRLSKPFYTSPRGRGLLQASVRPQTVWPPALPLPTSSSPSSWYWSSTLSSCWSGFPAICWNKRGGSGYRTLEMGCPVLWDKEQAGHHEHYTFNASGARKWWLTILNTKPRMPITRSLWGWAFHMMTPPKTQRGEPPVHEVMATLLRKTRHC